MAYRCPVCDNPETDAEHLANHLAFTAVIRGDGHESWLDEHVPDWGDDDPESLAPKVAEAVPEVDVPELEDDDHASHDHGGRLEDELAQQSGHRGPGAGGMSGAGGASDAPAGGRGDLTEDAAGVMQEAQRLTEQMYGLDEDGEDASRDDGADASDADAAEDASSESE
ncbi:DUF5810 domain-containing protein [Halorubellus litoreus]|uniref:DUF5810 domain-containing protein n=1 Tax=Halorubellus litoreus TaxID=755308 RepID=A0ABD5V8G0_9EURY